MKKVKLFFILVRVLFVLPGVNWKNEKLMMDISRWKTIRSISGNRSLVLAKLLSGYPEFRNLFIYRSNNGMYRRWVKLIYPPLDSLYLYSPVIGGGLFIEHGFSTMISAKSIGDNCWINQQVTIGHTDVGKAPVVGNNVHISCGAKVLGDIVVGDNAMIAAQACVVKDVEPNTVVGGVPARRLK